MSPPVPWRRSAAAVVSSPGEARPQPDVGVSPSGRDPSVPFIISRPTALLDKSKSRPPPRHMPPEPHGRPVSTPAGLSRPRWRRRSRRFAGERREAVAQSLEAASSRSDRVHSDLATGADTALMWEAACRVVRAGRLVRSSPTADQSAESHDRARLPRFVHAGAHAAGRQEARGRRHDVVIGASRRADPLGSPGCLATFRAPPGTATGFVSCGEICRSRQFHRLPAEIQRLVPVADSEHRKGSLLRVTRYCRRHSPSVTAGLFRRCCSLSAGRVTHDMPSDMDRVV